MRVIAAPTDHKPVEPTVGYRIEHDGAVGGARRRRRPVRGLDELCAGRRRLRADGAARGPRQPDPDPALPRHLDYHSTVAQAGETASQGRRRHPGPHPPGPAPAPGSEDEWVALAAEHFDGEIVFGDDLATVTG